MKLEVPICNLFSQLQYVLHELSNDQYVEPIAVLSNATIGQHVRHIAECFLELNSGYESGLIDYDKRKRDFLLETDKIFGDLCLHKIAGHLTKPDKELRLKLDYGFADTNAGEVITNYQRELIYNLEHTVHHMALIRIGVRAISKLELPLEFGVATSTLKYRNSCAQ